MKPTSHYLTCHGFNIHFTAWGDTSLPVVIAWHGLARTGRDFDPLAEQLAPHYRVIFPDTIGRGLSQWSHAPQEDYSFATYARITDLHVWRVGRHAYACALTAVTADASITPQHLRHRLQVHPEIVHATIELHHAPRAGA